MAQHQGRGAGMLPRERERESRRKTRQSKKRKEQRELLGRKQGREIQQGKSNGGARKSKRAQPRALRDDTT